MPTIDVAVSTSADDARWDGGDFSNSEAYTSAPGIASWGSEKHISMRFTGISGLSGATITNAYISLMPYGLQGTGTQLKIYGDDRSASPDAATNVNFMTIARTTAAVDWDADPPTYEFVQSPDIKTIIQELVNSYGDLSAIQIFVQNDHANDAANHFWQILTYDTDPDYGATLHIEYTTGGGSPITGSLSATLGAVTISAAGKAAIAGAVTKTLAGVSISATGIGPIKGALSATLGAVTISATGGTTPIIGSLSVTLGAVTISAAGKAAIVGTVTRTLDALTSSAAGIAPIKGVVSLTLGPLTGSAAGVSPIKGAASLTLGAASVSGVGKVVIVGAGFVTLGAVTISATGIVANQPTITGTLSTTLAAATLNAAGTVSNAPIYGTVSSTLAAVTGISPGKVAVGGGASSTLAAVSLSGTATARINGVANNTLNAGTLQSSGAIAVRGLLAGTLEAAILQAVIFLGIITTPETRIYIPGARAVYSPSTNNRIYIPQNENRMDE